MSEASLTIISRNYGSWSLRGWLLCEFAGLAVDVFTAAVGDEAARAELLLLSPSYLVPRLEHGDTIAWGVWAIAEHLHELELPGATFPVEPDRRAHCRSVCGEMVSGFANLRSALPMNIRAQHRGFNVWSGAQADIDRIAAIWRDCLERYGGPYLFGSDPTAADAMYAPVCTRSRPTTSGSTRTAAATATPCWPTRRWTSGSPGRTARPSRSKSSTRSSERRRGGWSVDRQAPASGCSLDASRS